MQPNVGENRPQIEALPIPDNQEQAREANIEKNLVVSPENTPQKQTVAASSQAATSLALPSQVVTDDMADDTAVTTVPADPSKLAADTDRIEKEWVDKAKQIINQTKEDPFEQKNEMSKVKADYIKKRFNKSLKTDDAVAK